MQLEIFYMLKIYVRLMKRFINQISGKFDSKERLGGTLASVLYLLTQGVQIFRVHNVREVKQGILIYKKIILNK